VFAEALVSFRFRQSPTEWNLPHAVKHGVIKLLCNRCVHVTCCSLVAVRLIPASIKSCYRGGTCLLYCSRLFFDSTGPNKARIEEFCWSINGSSPASEIRILSSSACIFSPKERIIFQTRALETK